MPLERQARSLEFPEKSYIVSPFIHLTVHTPALTLTLGSQYILRQGDQLPNSCSPPSQQSSSSLSEYPDFPDSASERAKNNILRITSWIEQVPTFLTLPRTFSCHLAVHPSAPSLTRFPSYLHPFTFHLLPGNPPTGSRPDGRDRQGKFSESSLGKITGTIARLVVLDDCRLLQPAHLISFLPIQVFTCQTCNISPNHIASRPLFQQASRIIQGSPC